jgi:hypothetical protein
MYKAYLVLGGAGLVGLQVCRQIARDLAPDHVVVASLLEAEARDAIRRLSDEFPAVRFTPEWGDVFVPSALSHQPRRALLADPTTRRQLLDALYGDFDAAYAAARLVEIIRTYRPDVVIDAVNTATGLSYQNVFDGAAKLLDRMTDDGLDADGVTDLEQFLLSQSVPQMIRHVRFLHRATTECRTQVYVKVGTTGTGGMGLNIPYTHSEDKPSQVLLAKTEAAFGHTGLLFLLARTPNSPIVKEVKPAAMIGYKAVKTVQVSDKHGNRRTFEARALTLGGDLTLHEPEDGYRANGDLVVSVVDTGENGVFTRGEFAAITAHGQMEYVTPEEIAQAVVLEIRGANTGLDVISALDGAVMNPSYKAGLVRQVAMSDLREAEAEAGTPSVALGRLGPPELSKLLFEAQLLKEACGSLDAVSRQTADALRDAVLARLDASAVRYLAPSVGIPLLLPDGVTLLRGPRINVPELGGHRRTAPATPEAVDAWAKKGWVDLRVANISRWIDRASRMIASRAALRESGSAAASIRSYLPTEFEIGEVVAWIFNNEIGGYRIK